MVREEGKEKWTAEMQNVLDLAEAEFKKLPSCISELKAILRQTGDKTEESPDVTLKEAITKYAARPNLMASILHPKNLYHPSVKNVEELFAGSLTEGKSTSQAGGVKLRWKEKERRLA